MTAARILVVLAIGGVLALTLPTRARQDGEVLQSRTLTIEGKTFYYRVFVPKGWSAKKKLPVILFLHGAAERGDDNLAQTRVGLGPAILRQQDTFPFIVVMPQCPRKPLVERTRHAGNGFEIARSNSRGIQRQSE